MSNRKGLVARLWRFTDRTASVDLTRYTKLLPAIGEREADLRTLSDEEIGAAADRLRKSVDDKAWLPDMCALGREAADRALGERPFDVQLLGAMGMLSGNVVQMATGEGKTLVGAIAAAGYALRGNHVHVVSVNDYLARRDAEWMRPVYDLLGVTVGFVEESSTNDERRSAYECEVTYGAVSEIGFDVLRDRLVVVPGDQVAPHREVAIIDEADSVLVDEARVPLVLAGSVDPAVTHVEIANIVRRLRPKQHYEVDPGRNVWLTPLGEAEVERALGGVDLYDDSGSDRLASVNLALHAEALLTRDVDYLVRNGAVQLINQSRGRVAVLQRWPDGLQAAVEAKEQLAPSDSGEILDSSTVQALISRYPTVAGMTGTAVAVADTLREFYELEVAVIPTDQENIRIDEPDRIFTTAEAKLTAIVAEIEKVHADGRPILIGTQDVAESDALAELLVQAGLTCAVLNARNDAEEAKIIAEAGAPGAITVSTQMAGRGTDIKLGGHTGTGPTYDDVVERGGLYVIGTARYQSSRLDDQLRGRAGRQGDPGGSVFFASLEDEVVLMGEPNIPKGVVAEDDGEVTDRRVPPHVDHAQRVLEGVNLEIHRNTWRYTRLIERQRDDILRFRDGVLSGDAAAELMRAEAKDHYSEIEKGLADDSLEQVCREILLFQTDRLWADHLAFLADVRDSIHLRALGKETPIDEFHRAAIPEFHKIIDEAKSQAVQTFSELVVVDGKVDLEAAGVLRPSATWTYMVHDNPFDASVGHVLEGMRSVLRKRFGRR